MSTMTVRGCRVMWVEIRGCTGVCSERIEDLPWTLVEMARAGELRRRSSGRLQWKDEKLRTDGLEFDS